MRDFTKVFFCFFIVLFCSVLEAKPLDLKIDAKSAILINAENGKVLFEKNAHDVVFPASITKIATALYVLEKYKERLEDSLIVSREALKSLNSEEKRKNGYASPAYYLEEGSSNVGLLRGEKESLYSLLEGMLIASGNDASNVVAEGIGGTIPHFMDLLNAYLKEIGCQKTFFKNPHGIHDPMHVTTAFEMGEITRKAMKNKEFQKIVSTLSYSRHHLSFSQTNRLMKKGKYFYPYALGVKTGYTSHADYNLVAAAEKEGRRLIAVILGCQENIQRYEDAIHLFEAAYAEKKVQKKLLKAPQVFRNRIEGAKTLVEAPLSQDLTIEFYPAEEEPLKLFLHWKELHLPIVKGSEVGAIEIYTEKKELLQKTPLYANEDVLPTFFFRWHQFFSSLFGVNSSKGKKTE